MSTKRSCDLLVDTSTKGLRIKTCGCVLIILHICLPAVSKYFYSYISYDRLMLLCCSTLLWEFSWGDLFSHGVSGIQFSKTNMVAFGKKYWCCTSFARSQFFRKCQIINIFGLLVFYRPSCNSSRLLSYIPSLSKFCNLNQVLYFTSVFFLNRGIYFNKVAMNLLNGSFSEAYLEPSRKSKM